jgi:hypothetical protein
MVVTAQELSTELITRFSSWVGTPQEELLKDQDCIIEHLAEADFPYQYGDSGRLQELPPEVWEEVWGEFKKYVYIKDFPFIPQLAAILDTVNWDRFVFTRALNLGNAIISKSGIENSYIRYQLHQQFNLLLSRMREQKLGEEAAAVVYDFFRGGEASEVSLFTGEMEQVRELFGGELPHYQDVVIGYGCRDLRIHPVVARFDLLVNHDWGWEDGMGVRTEEYNAETRIFFRSSMSGRTHYALKFDEKGVATPIKIPPFAQWMEEEPYSTESFLSWALRKKEAI